VQVVLLIAFGVSAVLPAVQAHYGGHTGGLARSTVGSRLPMDESEKAPWFARPQSGEGPLPSLFEALSVSAFLVLVVLLAVVLIYRNRKEQT
jgi:hypothetical protein